MAALSITFLLLTGSALGSRIETGGAHSLPYKGKDHWGKVTFQYTEIPIFHRGKLIRTDVTLTGFRFASPCPGRKSKVPGTIHVGANRRFNYHRRGVTVRGKLVGSIYQPRKITGTASQSTYLCQTGSLKFTARPALH